MFDDQNKKNGVEDILATTEPAVAPLGPPSALEQGKLQPISAKPQPIIPNEQMSGVYNNSFSIKKMLILPIIILVIIGVVGAVYFWWQTKSMIVEQAPILGSPNAEIAPVVSNPEPITNQESKNIIEQIQEQAIKEAIDPFATSTTETVKSAQIDTDADGLIDSEENKLGTNPLLVDTDKDGLSDWEEATVFGTDPLKSDTDGDGYLDGEEVKNGYNPKGTGKLLDFEKAKAQLK